MEINYDYLRTGTAIGFRACHELCSNYLYDFQSNTEGFHVHLYLATGNRDSVCNL